DPGGGLPGASALQHRPGVAPAVLLHPGQVGVAGTGPGQRRVARQPGQLRRVHRVGGHHLLPLRPLGVAHPDRHRAAQGLPVPDATDDLHLVLFEGHPRAAAVAQPPAGQLPHHLGAGHLDAGRYALQDRDQGRPVRLARCQPPHHAAQSVTRAGPAVWQPMAVLLLAFAGVLLLAVLVSSLAHRTILSTAALFLVAGFVLGSETTGVLHLVPESPVVTDLANLALFAVLFTDGMRVGWSDLRSAWRLPGRALGWGLPLTLVITALVAKLLVGL